MFPSANTPESEAAMARAGIGKALLHAFSHLRPDLQEAFERRVDPSHLESHATCNALRWIPMSHHMGLLSAIRALIGPGDPSVRFWTAAWSDLLGRPTLRWFSPRFPGARRPAAALLKHAPRILDQMFKNIGEVEVIDREASRYGLWSQSNFDTSRYDLSTYVEGTLGALEAGSRLVDETIVVQLVDLDESAGRFTVRFDQIDEH